MTPKRSSKSFFDMTSAEKARFVGRLEAGISSNRLKPLSRKERALWNAVKHSRGRPRKPAGAKAVPIRVTFEPKLLKQIDAFAEAQGISRAQLLARGARLALAR